MRMSNSGSSKIDGFEAQDTYLKLDNWISAMVPPVRACAVHMSAQSFKRFFIHPCHYVTIKLCMPIIHVSHYREMIPKKRKETIIVLCRETLCSMFHSFSDTCACDPTTTAIYCLHNIIS